MRLFRRTRRWSSVRWVVPSDAGTLCVALVGAGRMAREYLRVLESLDGVEAAAIASRTVSRARRLADEFGVAEVHDRLEALLTSRKVDALIVAVSHESSFPVGREALASGLPVLLEKPAAFTSEEVAELAAVGARSGALPMVAVNRRFYGALHGALLRLLQFGPVRGVQLTVNEPIADARLRARRSPWSLDRRIVSNGVHYFDLLRLIGGEIRDVTGFRCALREPFGDNFAVALEFEKGAVATYSAHWSSTPGASLRIFTDGAEARLEHLGLRGDLHLRTGEIVEVNPAPEDRRFKPGLYAQTAAFLRAVRTGRPLPWPASDLDDHRRTLELIESIVEL